MVIPRRRSSGSRSASIPVSARSSVVLPWSMWPAVPMTTVIRSRRPDGPDDRAARAASSAGSIVRRSSHTAPASTRAMTGGSAPRSRAASAAGRLPTIRRPTDSSVSPGSDPPPTAEVIEAISTRSGIDSGIAARTPAARTRSSSAVAAIIRQTGIRVVASPARYKPSVAARAARMTFSGRTARASGSRRIRAMRSARPTIKPACGPPSSLSPLNVTRSAPAARRSARHRLVGEAVAGGVEERAAAEVVDDDRTVLVGDPRDLDRVRRLDEAGLREVRRVDPEHDRGLAQGERTVEVGGACSVRRPDLDQPRAGPAHDLGDPDATADLDQLAARHRDPATAGQPDRERERGRVVDRDQRVLGAGQRDEVLPPPRGSAAHGVPRRGRTRAASSRSPPASPPRSPRRATVRDRGWCGGSRRWR